MPIARYRPARPGVRPLGGVIQQLTDFRGYGSVKVLSNDQIVLPKEARDDIRLEGASHYNLYGSPRLGVALLIGEPPTTADFVSRGRAINDQAVVGSVPNP